jgi:hypothetical protein
LMYLLNFSQGLTRISSKPSPKYVIHYHKYSQLSIIPWANVYISWSRFLTSNPELFSFAWQNKLWYGSHCCDISSGFIL